MAGSPRSASDSSVLPPLLPSAHQLTPLERFLRKNLVLRGDLSTRPRRQHSRLFDQVGLLRLVVPSKTAPPAMQAAPLMSPIRPSAGMTAADISSMRRRSSSLAPKTPSELAMSTLPLSPPVSPDKATFAAAEGTILVDGGDVGHPRQSVAFVPCPLSFAETSHKKGRKAPPAALNSLPKRQLFSVKPNKDPAGTEDSNKPKPARLNMKILEGIARRGGQVPVSHAPLVHPGPSLPATPAPGYGAQMGMLGLGIINSPLPLTALSPPSTRKVRPSNLAQPTHPRQAANISLAQASAAVPIMAVHKGRQMTFSPLPPEPDEMGRCTLIDEQGDPLTVYPRELQGWVYMPWVYWGMVCGRAFNLWFEPKG